MHLNATVISLSESEIIEINGGNQEWIRNAAIIVGIAGGVFAGAFVVGVAAYCIYQAVN